MSDPFHERYETNLGEEAATRVRFESKSLLEYELNGADFRNWPGFLYHSLADKFYDNPDNWWVIHDANPIRRPQDWKVGDIILVPKDFRDAFVQNEDELSVLTRKRY